MLKLGAFWLSNLNPLHNTSEVPKGGSINLTYKVQVENGQQGENDGKGDGISALCYFLLQYVNLSLCPPLPFSYSPQNKSFNCYVTKAIFLTD